MPEAPLERTEHGAFPSGEGWSVVNVRDAQWFDATPLGRYAPFEGEHAQFPQLGVNVSILRPGEPSCMYHGEGAEEGFLVLAGECLLVVEGQERPLRAWDYAHCPPWTEHVLVGAGDGPCLILSVGARSEGRGVVYPANDVARARGASVEKDTTEPQEAYASYPRPTPARCPEEFPAG